MGRQTNPKSLRFLVCLSMCLALPSAANTDGMCTKWTGQSCPNDRCRDTFIPEKQFFFREGLDLTKIPQDIPRNSVRVILRANMFTRLPVGIFNYLTSCEWLVLSLNRIFDVEPGAFTGLSRLKALFLRVNCITVVKSNMFKGLKSLQKLHLKDNEITVVEKGSFNSLASIYLVELSVNRLTTISPDVFINLPRPLHLPDFAQQKGERINCSSLCWLFHELKHNTVSDLFPKSFTTCSEGTWLHHLTCGDEGE